MEVRVRSGEHLTLKLRYRLLRWVAPLLATAWTVLLWLCVGACRVYVEVRTFIRELGKWLTFQLVRLRIHYLLEVSESAKCPACGIRSKHKIQWVDLYQAVMHECGRCKAHWGEKPVVKLEAWFVKPILPEDAPSDEVKITTKIRQVV